MSPKKEKGPDLELQALIKWYQENRIAMPKERFDLCPGTTVIDADRFYIAIDGDIVNGNLGGHMGIALKRQLEMLKAYVDSKERSDQ